jgi:hypothetical protein
VHGVTNLLEHRGEMLYLLAVGIPAGVVLQEQDPRKLDSAGVVRTCVLLSWSWQGLLMCAKPSNPPISTCSCVIVFVPTIGCVSHGDDADVLQDCVWLIRVALHSQPLVSDYNCVVYLLLLLLLQRAMLRMTGTVTMCP